MKPLIMLTLFMSLTPFCGAQEAPAQADPQAVQLREYYDKAFDFYMTGNYPKALEYFSMVQRLDPKQVTARNMIEEARKKMAGSLASQKEAFYSLIKKGSYADALLKLESMLAADPTNQEYQRLQGRLGKISAVTAQKPASSKPWNIATDGLAAWLGEKDDAAFAYDALRYCQELAPSEKRFPRLVLTLEEEVPQLKQNDSKPPNVGVLDHKKDVALHYIYESKFYLAVRELEGVLRLEPEDVIALKRLGSAHLRLKDYPKAKAAWQKASSLSPDDEQLKEYLAALNSAAPGAQTAEAKKPADPKTTNKLKSDPKKKPEIRKKADTRKKAKTAVKKAASKP